MFQLPGSTITRPDIISAVKPPAWAHLSNNPIHHRKIKYCPPVAIFAEQTRAEVSGLKSSVFLQLPLALSFREIDNNLNKC